MIEVIDAFGILVIGSWLVLMVLSAILWAVDKAWSALRHKP